MVIPEVDKETAIYRFVNFFDVYNLLKHKNLRITKMSEMNDRNEGLGLVLHLIEHFQPLSRYSSGKEMREDHALILENTYLSCWSKEPDLISHWSLYSEDKSGIRIKTTIRKLEAAVTLFHDENEMWTTFSDKKCGDMLSREFPEICEVEYVDFYDLKESIRGEFTKFHEMAATKTTNNPQHLSSPDGFSKDWTEFSNNKTIGARGWRLKDRAYQSEHELRAIMKCGIRNNYSLEDIKEAAKTKSGYIEPIDAAPVGTLPDIINIDVPEDFIEEICFDPRCQRFKKDVFMEILGPYKIPMGKSKVFGYAFDMESFAFDHDGNPIAT